MNATALKALPIELGAELNRRGEWLALAESCTGGLVAKLVTDVAGSSGWFERGLVTYSNEAKQSLLGVPAELIQQFGAVSQQCAQAMVIGLLDNGPAHWGIAITGIAGPGGGSADKPVGTVWIAWMQRGGKPDVRCLHYDGDREGIRAQAAATALRELLHKLRDGL